MCIRDSCRTTRRACAVTHWYPPEVSLRIVVAALVCSLPMAANAQLQRTGDYLSKMDVDRDGRVSLVEYQDWLSYAFDGMDRDGDGVLSAAEQPGGRGKPLSRAEHLSLIHI